MSEIYEPKSQFLERLEWQLSSEFRRSDRLKSAPNKIAIPRRMVAVTCILGLFLTGVAVIKAAEVIQDSWRKKIEIARFETDVELKKAHLESTREIAAQAEERFSDGLIHEREYQVIKLAVRKAELDLKRSMSNLDEVKISGEIPRNELHAPLLGGRDFVTERLLLEASEAELDLLIVRDQLARFKKMAETGVVEKEEKEAVQTAYESQEVKLLKIKNRLELRKRFLEGEISAKEVEIKGRLTDAERKLFTVRSKVEVLNRQMERLKVLDAKGMVSDVEVQQVKFALEAAQAELALATLEIEILKKVK